LRDNNAFAEREFTMTEGNKKSLHEMKLQTEATRADLTQTVDQLKSSVSDTATEIRDRLKPEAIKAEVSGYIKSRGEQLYRDIEESARRNPIQAVAIGASLAYPVLRLARAIPMPILMIGAGLFLASSKTGRDLTQKASDTAGEFVGETRRRVQDIGDQVVRTTTDAKRYAAEALDQAGEAAASASEHFRRSAAEITGIGADNGTDHNKIEDAPASVAGGLSDRLENARVAAAALAGDAADSIGQTVAAASTSVREAASAAANSGQEMWQNTRAYASDVSQQATQSLRETIEQNPLLVAGVGLLLGGVIAGALPKWQPEDNLLGDASAAVKRRATQAASAGLETAKGNVEEFLTNVARQAEAEGLTSEDLIDAMKDVRNRVQRVAERAVTTAFEPEGQKNEEIGGQYHG
jgi:hypothetical protein